jgi:hypothetical protein
MEVVDKVANIFAEVDQYAVLCQVLGLLCGENPVRWLDKAV